MSKGLEAFRKNFYDGANNKYEFEENLGIIEKALQRLEAIDNEKPSEALEDLEQLAEMADKCWVSCDVQKWKNTIKQTLIKSQEQKKVLEILFKKQVDLGWLWYCIHECINSLNEYNKKMPIEKFKFTQEEFDLLKRYFK